MGIPHYLAMTAAELSHCTPAFPTAWLACHFSAYHPGLSNLPISLPPGSLLVLDDSAPMANHDPEVIETQLRQCVQALNCQGLLLDFQRPDNPAARALAERLTQSFPCPVGVSHLYAQGRNCPVFLPPPPLHSPLSDHLQPWKGREIWLEAALEQEHLTLTKAGCQISSASEIPENGFPDEKLHCHYRAQILEDAVQFTLWRTQTDLEGLLAEAEGLGVTLAVGLWQELHE